MCLRRGIPLGPLTRLTHSVDVGDPCVGATHSGCSLSNDKLMLCTMSLREESTLNRVQCSVFERAEPGSNIDSNAVSADNMNRCELLQLQPADSNHFQCVREHRRSCTQNPNVTLQAAVETAMVREHGAVDLRVDIDTLIPHSVASSTQDIAAVEVSGSLEVRGIQQAPSSVDFHAAPLQTLFSSQSQPAGSKHSALESTQAQPAIIPAAGQYSQPVTYEPSQEYEDAIATSQFFQLASAASSQSLPLSEQGKRGADRSGRQKQSKKAKRRAGF